MRRTVVALVIAALALVLVGCGGAEEPEVEETDAAAAEPAPVVEPVEPGYMADRSANLDDVEPFVFPSFENTITPAAFQQKLDTRRPMLILFYDSRQLVTKDVRVEIDAVVADYRGLIDLVVFDVSGGGDQKAAEAATMYAAELDVQTTPHVLVVDGGSYVTWQWRGYIERDTLRREVERATR